MIDRVIICGLRCGSELMEKSLFSQMCGRCGRSYNVIDRGTVTLLVNERDSKYADEYFYGEVPSIKSCLSGIEEFSFHALPLIKNKKISDVGGLFKMYNRSLAKAQGLSLDMEEVVRFLIDSNMMDEGFNISSYGDASCTFYYRPTEMFLLKNRIELVISEQKFNNDYYVSWAIGTLKMFAKSESQHVDNYRSMLKRFGCSYDCFWDGLAHYCCMNGFRISELNNRIRSIKSNSGRLIALLKFLKNKESWDVPENCFDLLHLRLLYGVDLTAARLMLDLNFFKKSAINMLMEYGYNDLDSIIKNMHNIERYFEPNFVLELKQKIEEFENVRENSKN